MVKLYVLRHAPVSNPDKVFYGRLPGYHLKPEGRQVALNTARYLCKRPIRAVYSSPLERAQETAHIVAAPHAHLVMEVQSDNRLTEVLTHYQGRPWQEIAAIDWNYFAHFKDSASDERMQDVAMRLRSFMNDIHRRHHGQEVICVTHGDLVCFAFMIAVGANFDPAERATADMRTVGYPVDYPSYVSVTSITSSDSEVPGETKWGFEHYWAPMMSPPSTLEPCSLSAVIRHRLPVDAKWEEAEPWKVIVCPGSFNPVHRGHLAVMRQVIDKLGPRVLVAVMSPSAGSYVTSKRGDTTLPAEVRADLMREAIRDEGLESTIFCDDWELSGPIVNVPDNAYFPLLLDHYRDVAHAATNYRVPIEVMLICGEDAAVKYGLTEKNWAVVTERPGGSNREAPPISAECQCFRVPPPKDVSENISSSAIRKILTASRKLQIGNLGDKKEPPKAIIEASESAIKQQRHLPRDSAGNPEGWPASITADLLEAGVHYACIEPLLLMWPQAADAARPTFNRSFSRLRQAEEESDSNSPVHTVGSGYKA